MLVQGNQDIGGQREKFFRFRPVIQQARKSGIAEILEQQQTSGFVPGENGWRAETEPEEMSVNPDERCD
jgi:hypothetical protein